MLLYHPFFDTRHAVFRMLRLLEVIGPVEIEVQRLRILDFYLLFPTAILQKSLPRGNNRLRKELLSLVASSSYDVIPDRKHAFARLETIQITALGHLAALNLISGQSMQSQKVLRTNEAIPQSLHDLIKDRNERQKSIVAFLTTTYLNLPLYGEGGLRERADLFNPSYDIR